ncbi:hypothetical protein CJF32_00010716 [Rutstroemia sp. NJR-2017a WRK4]|nr:hypothetical protein CJF32_00010716 [Rutstroemia sp. NJR-2017a WRK4]
MNITEAYRVYSQPLLYIDSWSVLESMENTQLDLSAAQKHLGVESRDTEPMVIFFTNVIFNLGFVIGDFVQYLLVVIYTEKISLGLGIVPPLLLFYLRLRLKGPEEYTRYIYSKNTESMKNTRIPYNLVIKYYWWRLFVVSLIWLFSGYTYSYLFIHDSAKYPSKDCSTFVIIRAILGSFFSHWVDPRYTLAIGITLQALVGFIMAGLYPYPSNLGNIGGFVVYGIFLSLGEFGPSYNIGLIASKTCATPSSLHRPSSARSRYRRL